jgi:hypothetical protein
MRDAVDRRAFLCGSAAVIACGLPVAQGTDPSRVRGTYAFENALWFDGAGFRSGTFYSVNGTLAFERPTAIDETVDLSAHYVVPLVLKEAGVALAVGSDRYSDTAVTEAFALESLKVFSTGELLKMWCDTSARTIFPIRRIGALREGYEASFLVLNANPIADFGAVRSIEHRFKQGEFIRL